MNEALFDPGDLPLGTSVVTVLKFDFLDAITKFKNTLPADYIRDSWLKMLQKQCSELHSQFGSGDPGDVADRVSLLYLQMLFLKGLYLSVCGDAAVVCGWEKMPRMISPYLNGLGDSTQFPSDLFSLGMKATTEGELLEYLAYGADTSDRTGSATTTTACLVANTAAPAGD
ncbi:hypothetical protein PG996_015413 [Apiospora saccharicola]|uniref:Uncharacterized protein n=1 Tax=Apiospora saccharicola TaxID=335842 RepID=A0ABR1TL39_9PEZI